MKCLIIVLGTVLFISACSPDSMDRSVVAQDVKVHVHALDVILFDKTKDVTERHQELLKAFPKVYPLYFSEILLLGDVNSPSAPEQLGLFTEDEQWIFAESRIQEVFADMSEIEQGLSSALGRYKTIFPDQVVPDIHRLNTGYNYGMFPDGDVLGWGAEFYLGEEDPMVKRLPNEVFPAYARQDMRPEQVLPNMMKALLLVREQSHRNDKDLIGLMTFYGKVMYVLHLCIPDVPEYLHFAYSPEEMAWCQKNEEMIWTTLVSEELIYETDRKLLTSWTVRAPFTPGFSEESPGELGWFMGKQMVKDYMKKHPEKSPAELFQIPSQEILQAYRPG